MRIAVNGTTLWFDVEGAGLVADGPAMREKPTLVLLHGGPGFDHSAFKPRFSELADIAQVVYFDHRGNGRSDRSDPSSWRLDTWGDDVHALCGALGIEAPIVLGWSFGGFVAINYATRYPDHPRALVLQSTAARNDLDRTVEGFRAVGGDEAAEAARAFWSGPSDATLAAYAQHCLPCYSPGPMDFEEMGRIAMNPDLLTGFEGEMQMDQRAALANLRCPTLVLAGGLDPITPVSAAEEIVASAPGARLEVFEKSGHFIATTEQEAFLETLRAFIASVWAVV